MCLDNYETVFYITLRPLQAARNVKVFAPEAKVTSVLCISKHYAMRLHHSAWLPLHTHTFGNYLPTYAICTIRRPQDMCHVFC